MTCALCKRPKLPHQMAHNGVVAVCFGGDSPCGSGATRAPFWLEKVEDSRAPVYAQLRALVNAVESDEDRSGQARVTL